MRLIDADALIEATKNFCDSYEVGWTDRKVIAWINGAPSVDAVEVVHGRWIPIEEKVWNLDFPVVVDWKCSACNGMGNEDFNYCPNCGAKMDGGNNG